MFKQEKLLDLTKFECYKEFKKSVGSCAKCGMKAKKSELEKLCGEYFRSNFQPTAGKMTKYGHGDPNSDLMMVGLAPSKSPESNVIFGAKSQEIYENYLEMIGRTRDTVWQTNLVKCYIPEDKVGECDKCLNFLGREIRIINPDYIVLFGRDVVDTVLGEGFSLEGKVITSELYDGISCCYITSYHPCYPLHGGTPAKEKLFDCAEEVRKVLEGENVDVFEC